MMIYQRTSSKARLEVVSYTVRKPLTKLGYYYYKFTVCDSYPL